MLAAMGPWAALLGADSVQGSTEGQVRVQGLWPQVSSAGEVRAQGVLWRTVTAQVLTVPACLASAGAPPVKGRCGARVLGCACGPHQRLRFLP